MKKNTTKRKDGRMQRSFTVSGKRYYVYGTTKQELDQKEHEKRTDLESKLDRRTNPTLDQYHDSWAAELAKTVKGSTIRSHSFRYKACANIRIESTGLRLGDMKLKEITVDDIREVQKGLQNGKRTTETVNNDIAHLSHIFHTAIIERKIDYNPCMPVKPLKRTEPEARDTIHRALTQEELDKFFAVAKERSFYYDVYRFALNTGLRAGEIGALRHADIKDGFINVRATVTKDEIGCNIIGESTKTKKGTRKIPINNTIRQILDHQKAINAALDGNVIDINDRIFKAPERGLLVVFPIDRDIAKICKRAEIERFSMHAFRDTFATRALMAGINPRTLQELLGHANFNLTMSLYGHVLTDTLNDAMSKLDQMAK